MKKSRYILITGCSSGIGYKSAHILKNLGYTVIATARKDDDVKRLQEEGFIALKLDLDDSSSIDSTVKQVKEITNSRLYALFNNAAYGQPGAVEDLSREVLKAQFETNLFGTHELTVKLLPMMIEAGEGRIIQNSSVLGFAAMRYRGAYNASKFALEGLSDTLRLELEGTGVYISIIEPGPIRSKFRANALKKFLENIDRKNSRLSKVYEKKLAQLQSSEDAPFTLDPDAVAKALLHALESNSPKVRYKVTVPTHLFYWLKKFLPEKVMDFILRKVE
ncbi:SDR family NAD(P)-dependent oxidoreductase [Hydrogenimonas thermophila]|uniref:Short-chain dehydrogenase n=1 Tax=Hydrogenimonas thermophila TaxID=223786 RepID=A0A1I5R7Z1_9BACT|nr:SDR family NAD(P)-dependent oxidoreductase [Hydrogenimonas thermophila]WOE70705.1 SDR family NAD(P)-dependent oxidoreductase [Hydrogenimonas thermophila]WOE73223.1 SDR family NAD(P)-dependent oxidoreductase [Hydrogenimonas thermophila]SFP54457.1 Short-chain dehydrogenase [Hydrogenimonas thermophila]